MTKRRIIWITLLPTMLIGFMGLMLIKNVPPALAGSNSQGNSPGLISYQGYLTDSAGQPLNGTVSLTVSGMVIDRAGNTLLEGVGELFEDGRRSRSSDDTAEVATLYEQIGRLKVELDWLKKTAARFDDG